MKKMLLLLALLFLTSCTPAASGAVMLKEVPLRSAGTDVTLPAEVKNSIFDLSEEFTADYFTSAEKENQIFSPVSLWYALGILREGAQGETLDELNRLMKLEPDFDSASVIADLSSALNFLEDSELIEGEKGGIRLSNGLFISEAHRDNILESYLESAAGIWGAETAVVDFTKGDETREIIRQWVSDKTDEFIPDYEAFFREDQSTILNIYNVLYLQDHWLMPFSLMDDQVFHAPTGDVNVPFMSIMDEPSGWYEGDDFKAAAFPGETGLQLWYILPEEGNPHEFIPEIRNILSAPDENRPIVNLKAPILDIDGENLPMKELLIDKGYSNMFTTADLSGMLEGTTAAVDEIRQKTRLQVDEKGFKAAAVTEISIRETAMPEYEELTLDRPFLLVIEYQGLPLFIASISNPAAK